MWLDLDKVLQKIEDNTNSPIIEQTLVPLLCRENEKENYHDVEDQK